MKNTNIEKFEDFNYKIDNKVQRNRININLPFSLYKIIRKKAENAEISISAQLRKEIDEAIFKLKLYEEASSIYDLTTKDPICLGRRGDRLILMGTNITQSQFDKLANLCSQYDWRIDKVVKSSLLIRYGYVTASVISIAKAIKASAKNKAPAITKAATKSKAAPAPVEKKVVRVRMNLALYKRLKRMHKAYKKDRGDIKFSDFIYMLLHDGIGTAYKFKTMPSTKCSSPDGHNVYIGFFESSDEKKLTQQELRTRLAKATVL